MRDVNETLDLACKIFEKKTDEQIIDARPSPRFNGEAPEPRPTKFYGHIPGAKNVFFKNLLNENLCLKSKEELIKEFEKSGVDIERNITLYCGSGVTASVDLFALTILGKYDKCKLYDGSWSEYVKSFIKKFRETWKNQRMKTFEN